jgi:Flp pilus assembly protein TadG
MIIRSRSASCGRRFRRDRRGTEILEAAFLFLPLLWLTFGAIDFGFYFFIVHNCEGAAREGARAGVVPGATSGTVSAAATNVMNQAGLTGATVTGNPAVNAGQTFTVTVSFPYKAIGVPPARVPSKLLPLGKVTATMVMMKEG